MTDDVQTDLFGGETPVDDLALSPALRDLAAYARRFDDPLTPMEAGAFLHERRGRHALEQRCTWCVSDGYEALWNRQRYCTRYCRVWGPSSVARVIHGDSRVHSGGYTLLYCPWYPRGKGSYVYEHRVVMERKLGRLLASDEHVHHRNGVRSDNLARIARVRRAIASTDGYDALERLHEKQARR